MPFSFIELESQALAAGPGQAISPSWRRLHAMPRVAEKTYPVIGTYLTTALSPVTAFVVNGLVRMRVVGISDAALASTGTNGTLAVGISGATTALLGTTTVDGTNFPAANSVWIDTTPTLLGEAAVANNLVGYYTASNVIITVGVNNMTTGGLALYCIYEPIAPGASVTAA